MLRLDFLRVFVPGAIVFNLFFGLVSAEADPLTYGKRDGRFEGVMERPISGREVQLLGAMVEPLATGDVAKDTVTAELILERESTVALSIREARPNKDYWLDRVQPGRRWPAKVPARFQWPGSEVLLPLRLNLGGLLALARVGYDKARLVEEVAPVRLYQGKATGPGSGYRFTFGVKGEAELDFRVVRERDGKEVGRGKGPRVVFGALYVVSWPCATQPEGRYRVEVDGRFVADNAAIRQQVRFFHSTPLCR